jgi:hypothetical protein
MDKLLDHLKNVKYEINVDCFEKVNLPHIQPEILQLSVSVPMSHPFGNESEDLYHDKFTTMIISEISQSVVKKILQSIFNNGKKSFIDLTNRFGNSATQFENAATRSRKIVAKIHYDLPQKYLITNGRICSDYFMDSSAFVPLPISNKITNSGGLIYPSGSIHLQTKRDIWIDPFMRWDDNHILCFDEVRLDISNFSFSLKNSATFAPQVLFSLDLRFEVINAEAFFIYEDDYKKNWDIQSIVKQEDRDKKIDYILDGNQESGSNSQFGIYFDDKLES